MWLCKNFLADIVKVSSSGGYTLAKVLQTLKKNTIEKLKEFVSLFCASFTLLLTPD